MRHPTVIFAPDNQSGQGLMDFSSYLTNSGLTKRQFKRLVGSYKGVEEASYLMTADLFDKHVRGTEWVANQESFLHVTGCNKAYAVLEYADGKREGLGSMCAVPRYVAKERDAWTYRPDTNTWFICENINPDHAGELI